MWRATVAALLLSVSGPLFAQGSKWTIVAQDKAPNRVSLLPDIEGFSSLEEAIAEVSEDQIITDIRLHPRVFNGDEMQEEVYGFLEKRYPEELEEALASSGNLHNPKLYPLFGPLREAILATRYVTRLGELLAPSRHRIVGATFEKVAIAVRAEPPSFTAIVWLTVEKVPEQEAEDGSPSPLAPQREPESR